MNKTLLDLLSKLNDAQLTYAIGGSMLLKLRSLDVLPKDLDIMVSEAHFHRVVAHCQTIGTSIDKPSLTLFKTKNFATFQVDDMNIDIMAGFAYEHIEGTYYAVFDSLSITDHVDVKGHLLPLMSLEEWYVIYMIMSRQKQGELIESFWKNSGIEYPHLLIRQQSQIIPKFIDCKIKELLKNY